MWMNWRRDNGRKHSCIPCALHVYTAYMDSWFSKTEELQSVSIIVNYLDTVDWSPPSSTRTHQAPVQLLKQGHWLPSVGPMLCQRLRRWHNIEPALGSAVLFWRLLMEGGQTIRLFYCVPGFYTGLSRFLIVALVRESFRRRRFAGLL